MREAVRFFLVSLCLFAESALCGAEDTWLEGLAPLPGPRQEVGIAALDGKVYVIGGLLNDFSATGRVDRYDVASGEWEDVPSLLNDTELHHIGAAAVAGKVYSIGGLDRGFRGVSSVFAFDPTMNEWSEVSSLPTPRGGAGVAVLAGRIYVAGGQTGSTSFSDFASYDPVANEWSELQPMPTARNHLAAGAHNGKFFAVGGRNFGLLFGTLEVYDPASGDWDELSPLPTPRAGIAAAVIGDEMFVFGGEGNAAAPDGLFPQVESYLFSVDRWFDRGVMPVARHGIGAAATDADGSDAIFIPGGSTIEGVTATDRNDAFVPGTTPGFALFRRGDANRDGAIDVSDPIFTLIHLFVGNELACEDAADANDDGELDVSDAIFALNHLFAGGEQIPAPGPEAGNDPTPDTLLCFQ